MNNLDLIPIARNTSSTIEKRYEYVRECIQNNGENTIFLDKAGFHLPTTSRQKNHRAACDISLPASHGGNISVVIALTGNGLLHHHVQLDPYNATKLKKSFWMN